MRKFEYKAIPAPTQGTKAKGVKSTEDRFALSFSNTLNDMATEGWEYVRAETLPATERKGFTGTQQTYQNILIFRRLEAAPLPLAEAAPRPVSQPIQPVAEPVSSPVLSAQPRVMSVRPPDGSSAPTVRVSLDD